MASRRYEISLLVSKKIYFIHSPTCEIFFDQSKRNFLPPQGHVTSSIYYYSFKIFTRFWLGKAMCIIHHNQRLNCHIELMTSKWRHWFNNLSCWTIILNCWPRKPGDEVDLFWLFDQNGKTDLRECYPPPPSALVDNTLLELQNSSYATQPHSIIAKYLTLFDLILTQQKLFKLFDSSTLLP